MNVGELRKALEAYPDDALVLRENVDQDDGVMLDEDIKIGYEDVAKLAYANERSDVDQRFNSIGWHVRTKEAKDYLENRYVLYCRVCDDIKAVIIY
jgi:hypothetical protein